MTVAHDVNLLAEQERKENARKFVKEAAQTLYKFRLKTPQLESGELNTWQDARSMAQEFGRRGLQLQLGLLVACAKEVTHFTDRYLNGEKLHPDLMLYMLSAMDTLGMELERLKHDSDLR